MTRERATEDAIRLTLRVPASVERAYAVLTEEFASWYQTDSRSPRRIGGVTLAEKSGL